MTQQESNVSVVIPTRNRINSLNRSLSSIYKQSRLPKEIIIIDSSDSLLSMNSLKKCPDDIELLITHTQPSVCLQRNIGIDLSTGDFILLCDDDIEFDLDYIKKAIETFKITDTDTVSGLIVEKNHTTGKWSSWNPEPKILKLLFTYIFALPITSNIINKPTKGFIHKKLISFYNKKGNHIAKSGWPIITNLDNPNFKSTIYGLGAAMFRASTLKKKKYDEAFYHHGIGDNYDLAIRINPNKGIFVNTAIEALHYKEPANRFKNHRSYFYRGLALSYILNKNPCFKTINKLYLIWSLIGASLLFLLTGKFRLLGTNIKLLFYIIFRKNPYSMYKS